MHTATRCQRMNSVSRKTSIVEIHIYTFSLQLFLPLIPCSLRTVTVISDTTIDIFLENFDLFL